MRVPLKQYLAALRRKAKRSGKDLDALVDVTINAMPARLPAVFKDSRASLQEHLADL